MSARGHHAVMIAASAEPPETDPYFEMVQLLLHGEGANGGTVFVDSSLNNASVTRYVGAHAGITTSTENPMGGSSSIKVPGNQSGRLQVPADTKYRGAGMPWTLEISIYCAAYTGVASKVLIDTNNDNSNTTGFGWYIDGSTGDFGLWQGDTGEVIAACPSGLVPNQRQRLMMSWDETTVRFFREGTLVGAFDLPGFTNTWSTTSGFSILGDKFNQQSLLGYASDCRFTAGVNRHSEDYTPHEGHFPST